MGGFQKVWASIMNNPVTLTEAIRQVIFVLILFELIHWTEAQTIGLLSAISAILAIFVRSNTVAAPRVEQKVDELVAHREMAGTTGTGTGMNPPASRVENRSGTGTTGTTGMMIFLAIGLSAALAGCASGMHGAAKVEDVAHDGLMAFDRALDTRCDAGELTAATCKELNSLLVPVWDLKNNLNRAIAGSAGSASVRLADFRLAIQNLMAKVTELVQGGAKDLLLRELNLAYQQ